jgi:hypothetical protein
MQRFAQEASVNHDSCHVAYHESDKHANHKPHHRVCFGEDAVVKQENGDPDEPRGNGVQETCYDMPLLLRSVPD